MFKPEGDQTSFQRQRHQTLGSRPRNVELAGDLVLRVARDEIKPAGARRVVET
jgi:hypothetical protein